MSQLMEDRLLGDIVLQLSFLNMVSVKAVVLFCSQLSSWVADIQVHDMR